MSDRHRFEEFHCRAGTIECLPDDLQDLFNLLDFGQHLFSIAALRIFKPCLEL